MSEKTYQIITDATSDLPTYLVEELGVKVIPMQLEMDGQAYLYDSYGKDITNTEFYSRSRSGQRATTSQVNTFTFIETFTPVLESGLDVLYLGFSSGLSGTMQAAVIAAQELKSKYPDRQIRCIDTLAASLGEGLMVYVAVKMQMSGVSIDVLAKWVEDNTKNLCMWFTVDDLMHLKRGGRVSATSAVMGTALKIKPIMHVDSDGHLMVVSKVQGRKHALKTLVKNMVERYVPNMNEIVFIGHGDALEDAQYVKQLVQEKLSIDKFVIDFIGPVIGSHAGPGTIAVFYFGTSR